MKEIKKVGLMSVAKVLMLFGVLLGLFQGTLMGIISSQYASEGVTLTVSEAFEYIALNPTAGFTPLFLALGWWSILVSPILTAIGYFIMGIVLAWVFNMAVKLVGGIKIEIDEKVTPKKKK